MDKDNEPTNSSDEIEAFNTAVAQLSAFNQPQESAVNQTEVSDPERDNELECFTQTYKGAPGFNELFTLDPTTDVIYPGALLLGESIPTGEYIGISAERAPITISTSLVNVGNSSIVIDNPNNLNEVRQGINDLLSQEVTGATPAAINLDISEVYSEEHLSVAVGANYKGVTKKVSANLDFSNSQYKNTFVLKFIQRYFTLDLNNPGSSPSDLFKTLPDVNRFGSTNPVYVSSVTYGRMVLYTVETNSSITNVKAAFDASVASTDGSIDTEYENILNSSKIQALIIGGSGNGAVQAINGPQGVYEFISEGGNYGPDSPGAPLAYKMRYVKQGFPVARVVMATEYQVRECDLAYPEIFVEFVNITGTQPTDTEVNGWLRTRMRVNGDRIDMNNNGYDDGETWSRSQDEFVEVQNDKTYSFPDSYTYTFKPYKPGPNDYVELYGELFDYNGFGFNESLGNADGITEVKYGDLLIDQPRDIFLNFKKEITVKFRVTRKK
jgi:thiol-activated cytolysin